MQKPVGFDPDPASSNGDAMPSHCRYAATSANHSCFYCVTRTVPSAHLIQQTIPYHTRSAHNSHWAIWSNSSINYQSLGISRAFFTSPVQFFASPNSLVNCDIPQSGVRKMTRNHGFLGYLIFTETQLNGIMKWVILKIEMPKTFCESWSSPLMWKSIHLQTDQSMASPARTFPWFLAKVKWSH